MAYANFSQNNTKTQIKFFSGSQADLTKYIKGTTEAIEGAFYLTTDTQKLYVGRKDQNDGKVYAVQVSRGVTFVSSSSQLPSVTANDIEEGELYYITSSNILAALKHVPADNTVTPAISDHYEWVQINPPTGINTVSTSAVNESGTNNVILSTLISTAAGSKTGKTKFIAGNNITLTGGDTTLGESPNTFAAGTVTINATDTTYSIGTDATPNNKTEGIIELRTNGNTSDTHNTQVSIKGYSSTDTNGDDGTNLQVSSDDQGNVIIRGTRITGITNTAVADGDGFKIGLSGTNGAGGNLSIVQATALDPIIKYGQNNTEAHFASGTATLNIYTKAETDSAIASQIQSQLQVADALKYCGTVYSSANLLDTVIANGGAHNGDVYKVTAPSDGPFVTFRVGNQTTGPSADVGDLIIFHGTEATSGDYAGQILIGGTGVSNGAAGNSNNYTPGALLSQCELVPSGDEPEVMADVPAATNIIWLKDGKNGASTNILQTTYVAGTKLGVTTTDTTNSVSNAKGKYATVEFSHNSTTRTDTTNSSNTLTAPSSGETATDEIGNNKIRMLLLDSTITSNKFNALTTDTTGHVEGLKGKVITFQHNALDTTSTNYNIKDGNNETINGLARFSLKDRLNNTKTFDFKLASSTLNIVNDTTNSAVNLDLVWGTF